MPGQTHTQRRHHSEGLHEQKPCLENQSHLPAGGAGPVMLSQHLGAVAVTGGGLGPAWSPLEAQLKLTSCWDPGFPGLGMRHTAGAQ